MNPLPSCFLSNLHFVSVTIRPGVAAKSWMGIKALLKNSIVLKEMTIKLCHYYYYYEVERDKLYMDLLKLPRGSRDCSIFVKIKEIP